MMLTLGDSLIKLHIYISIIVVIKAYVMRTGTVIVLSEASVQKIWPLYFLVDVI